MSNKVIYKGSRVGSVVAFMWLERAKYLGAINGRV